ncbi:hypothetical protein [Burkholderia vietnamiensis]|uniref:hypothetical protein n=1 Tax=Burkholderia vietnamiensis TaxID=60552 RepID=UPI00264E265C|nr:hypothetical protein [Burkholderia vietnamiensis]MDN8035780.1 hypothetical protein [Burkholderia vietnamiensis]
MNAEANQTEILYLLDRNVVSHIKKANSGKGRFNKKTSAALENPTATNERMRG